MVCFLVFLGFFGGGGFGFEVSYFCLQSSTVIDSKVMSLLLHLSSSLMYVVFGISAISCRTILYFETPKFFQVHLFKDDNVWFASQEAFLSLIKVCKNVNVVIAYYFFEVLG